MLFHRTLGAHLLGCTIFVVVALNEGKGGWDECMNRVGRSLRRTFYVGFGGYVPCPESKNGALVVDLKGMGGMVIWVSILEVGCLVLRLIKFLNC